VGDPPPPAPKPKGLVELVKEGAHRTISGLGKGFDVGMEGAGHALEGAGHALEGASHALAAPEAAELAPLFSQADLPNLAGAGPLGAISTRLDREADLFRSIALRELARIGWVERVTQSVVVVAAVCEIVIAACATAAALFGGTLEGRAGLFFLAALVVATGAGVVLFSTARTRASHGKLADAALARAKAIEEKILRVGIAMEWRAAGDALFQDALARLERDVAPSPQIPSTD
jgi:hypothetical protein